MNKAAVAHTGLSPKGGAQLQVWLAVWRFSRRGWLALAVMTGLLAAPQAVMTVEWVNET